MHLCQCGCGHEVTRDRNIYLRGHWGRGKKYSIEHCSALREGINKYHQQPGVHEKYVQSMREKSKKCWEDPEYRARKISWMTTLIKQQWRDPNFRAIQAEGNRTNWNNPEFRNEQSALISKRMKQRWMAEEYRLLKSEQAKQQWENMENKDEVIKRLIEASHACLRPNKTEQKLIHIISANDLPFIYVGDGSFILGGKCPDFLNVNGKKQLIELYGEYWHKDDNPQDRIDFFQKYGFDCLIIWDYEIDDEETIVNRIKTFS